MRGAVRLCGGKVIGRASALAENFAPKQALTAAVTCGCCDHPRWRLGHQNNQLNFLFRSFRACRPLSLRTWFCLGVCNTSFIQLLNLSKVSPTKFFVKRGKSVSSQTLSGGYATRPFSNLLKCYSSDCFFFLLCCCPEIIVVIVVVSMAQSLPSTPKSASAPAPQPDESRTPGKWRHPQMDEIVRRQNAGTFGDRNIKKLVWNGGALFATWVFGNSFKS